MSLQVTATALSLNFDIPLINWLNIHFRERVWILGMPIMDDPSVLPDVDLNGSQLLVNQAYSSRLRGPTIECTKQPLLRFTPKCDIFFKPTRLAYNDLVYSLAEHLVNITEDGQFIVLMRLVGQLQLVEPAASWLSLYPASDLARNLAKFSSTAAVFATWNVYGKFGLCQRN